MSNPLMDPLAVIVHAERGMENRAYDSIFVLFRVFRGSTSLRIFRGLLSAAL